MISDVEEIDSEPIVSISVSIGVSVEVVFRVVVRVLVRVRVVLGEVRVSGVRVSYISPGLLSRLSRLSGRMRKLVRRVSRSDD